MGVTNTDIGIRTSRPGRAPQTLRRSTEGLEGSRGWTFTVGVPSRVYSGRVDVGRYGTLRMALPPPKPEDSGTLSDPRQ